MNVFKLCVAIVSLFTVVSCSNEDLENVLGPDQNPNTKSVGSIVDNSVVAQLLVSVEIDRAIMNEVKMGIDRSVNYGLDEEFRFTDMLSPSNSKLCRMGQTPSLIQKMSDKISSSLLRSSISPSDFFEYLSKNDIQIYWPYSEDWDGETLPVITFNPENGNEDWNYGYKQVKEADGTISIDTVIVDEVYVTENPVWVINRNETRYEDLPDLENGIYEKNGVVFDQSVDTNIIHPEPRYIIWEPKTDPDLIYTFYIQNMRVFKQLDGVLAGGSEIVVQCAYPEIEGGMKAPVTRLKKTWSRKEISKSKIKTFTTPLITSWRQEQLQCGLKIIEEDNGDAKNWEFSLGVKFNGKDYGVNAKIPFQNHDDEIVEIILDREYINSRKNIAQVNTPEWGIWKMYSENGVAYTLPILTDK